MEVTLTIPDELAARLRPVASEIPRIIELGLRHLTPAFPQFAGLTDVLEALARLPAPEEVLALRPSLELQTRIEELLAKISNGGLSEVERAEWQEYQYVEHLVRLAKAKAAAKVVGK